MRAATGQRVRNFILVRVKRTRANFTRTVSPRLNARCIRANPQADAP